MNKGEFGLLVDNLVNKAKSLSFYDYDSASEIIMDFKYFVSQHGGYLNPFVLEHLYGIEADFERSKKYRRANLKSLFWNRGINNLQGDISSMKIQNSYPEE
jgi:hypothetical protein